MYMYNVIINAEQNSRDKNSPMRAGEEKGKNFLMAKYPAIPYYMYIYMYIYSIGHVQKLAASN